MLMKRAILQSYGLHTINDNRTCAAASAPHPRIIKQQPNGTAPPAHCSCTNPDSNYCRALLMQPCNPPNTMVCTSQMTASASQPQCRSTPPSRQNTATQCCSTTCHATAVAPTQTFISSTCCCTSYCLNSHAWDTGHCRATLLIERFSMGNPLFYFQHVCAPLPCSASRA